MIKTSRHDGVLEIVVDNPPVNALDGAVREGLMQAVRGAAEDNAVAVVVIRGEGRMFSAGADITEFDKPLTRPILPEVIDAIEASGKPVVAAIHGSALGGGLEVALGCHHRVATASAKFGLPEVKLGILPGGGGTQRLPRLVGVEAELGMVVLGDPITAHSAREIGLIDEVLDDADFPAEAIAYARGVNRVRRTGELAVVPDEAAIERFEAANQRRIRGVDAPTACIEAIRGASSTSLDEGQEHERALFVRLVGGDQSKALRHAFFAERAAAVIKDLPKVPARKVESVGVIGAGTMGGGIVMNFLSVGIPVTLVEVAQDALDRGVAVVRGNYEASAAKGRSTPEKVEAAMALITPTTDFGRLADCDLVIEAVYEDMDLKKGIFARLDGVAKPGAILATNTSYLSVDEIALATSRPQDVIGLHFFSPANVMRLVEVVRGARTAPDVLTTGMGLAKRIGKIAVVAGVCYGFIGNRMLLPRIDQSFRLLKEGATPEQIDRVHVAFGLPMGPFRMADLAGVDLGWHRDPGRIETVQDAMCAAGRWGQKVGKGFYDYDEKRRATPSSEAARIIAGFRGDGVASRTFSDEEILVRSLYTMMNEGAAIVDEGIAQRPSDIDVVWVHGYGWPAHKGGPMFWADHIGARALIDAFRKYEKELGSDFRVAPLLRRCADEGVSLEQASR